MSEIISPKNDKDVKLWDAAVEYCNKNYTGDDNKYAACHKTFLDAVTSQSAKEYWGSIYDGFTEWVEENGYKRMLSGCWRMNVGSKLFRIAELYQLYLKHKNETP